MPRIPRISARLLTGAVLAGGLVLAMAAPALAHVTVSSPDASPGGFGKVVFRVPSEAPTARTVRVAVTLPSNTPFAFVSTKVHPGWRVSQQEAPLPKPMTVEGFRVTKAVRTVTWTAEPGAGIEPAEFDEFELSVGPFPTDLSGPLMLVTTQTYSDGTVVRWNEPPLRSGEEPEHPAPTLAISAAAAVPSETSDGLTRTIAFFALALGMGALVTALIRRPVRHAVA